MKKEREMKINTTIPIIILELDKINGHIVFIYRLFVNLIMRKIGAPRTLVQIYFILDFPMVLATPLLIDPMNVC
jgi:hypothetical protein